VPWQQSDRAAFMLVVDFLYFVEEDAYFFRRVRVGVELFIGPDAVLVISIAKFDANIFINCIIYLPKHSKVRRVKRSSSASVSGDLMGTTRLSGSASVAGDQIAVSRESSLTDEVYVRADGKKVRRVKKSSVGAMTNSSSAASLGGNGEENVEIITRPDGTRVRRIKKPIPTTSTAENSTGITSTAATADSASTNGAGAANGVGGGLSGFFGNQAVDLNTKKFSGSHSVAGDQHLDGEIYVRADGKKVRRVRKVKSAVGGSGASLSGFLDSEDAAKPRQTGGAMTVSGGAGVSGTENSEALKPETEIYVRPDGTVSTAKESV
jgi:hypothetical protein